jgi:hypothetical protein
MSDLIQEFKGKNVLEWKNWYIKRNPNAIDKSLDRIMPMIDNLKDAINKIDKKMVKDWLIDLLVYKTFSGLKNQEAILKKVAEIKNTDYRLSDPKEEAKGVDGLIGERKVSIKPYTYKAKKSLSEKIDCDFIFYEKKKDGINIDINF